MSDSKKMKLDDLPDDILIDVLCAWLTIREWCLLHGSCKNNCDFLTIMKSYPCNSEHYSTYSYLDWAVTNRIRVSSVWLDDYKKPKLFSNLDMSFVTAVMMGYYPVQFEPKNSSCTDLNLRCNFEDSELLVGFVDISTLKSLSIVALWNIDRFSQAVNITTSLTLDKIIRNNPNLQNVRIANFNGIELPALGSLSNVVSLKIESVLRLERVFVKDILKIVKQNAHLKSLVWRGSENWIFWECDGVLDFKFNRGLPKFLKDLLTFLSARASSLYFEIKPLSRTMLWSVLNCTPTISLAFYRVQYFVGHRVSTILAEDEVLSARLELSDTIRCREGNKYEYLAMRL